MTLCPIDKGQCQCQPDEGTRCVMLTDLGDALKELVSLKDLKDRLHSLHEAGHGTDYDDYRRRKPLAWRRARDLAARLPRLHPTSTTEGFAEFEVLVNDEPQASASGPRQQAMNEALRYATQYAGDGEVRINEVLRFPVTPNVRHERQKAVPRFLSAR